MVIKVTWLLLNLKQPVYIALPTRRRVLKQISVVVKEVQVSTTYFLFGSSQRNNARRAAGEKNRVLRLDVGRRTRPTDRPGGRDGEQENTSRLLSAVCIVEHILLVSLGHRVAVQRRCRPELHQTLALPGCRLRLLGCLVQGRRRQLGVEHAAADHEDRPGEHHGKGRPFLPRGHRCRGEQGYDGGKERLKGNVHGHNKRVEHLCRHHEDVVSEAASCEAAQEVCKPVVRNTGVKQRSGPPVSGKQKHQLGGEGPGIDHGHEHAVLHLSLQLGRQREVHPHEERDAQRKTVAEPQVAGHLRGLARVAESCDADGHDTRPQLLDGVRPSEA
eukprot:Rhum_TRINITY_DN16853_c0_g1::Rhum_TRINITY_DN16853_c0_g1_i1::g.164641::m.164641